MKLYESLFFHVDYLTENTKYRYLKIINLSEPHGILSKVHQFGYKLRKPQVFLLNNNAGWQII